MSTFDDLVFIKLNTLHNLWWNCILLSPLTNLLCRLQDSPVHYHSREALIGWHLRLACLNHHFFSFFWTNLLSNISWLHLIFQVIKHANGCNLAVDVWSLGCTVLEMATGKPPWNQYEGVSESESESLEAKFFFLHKHSSVTYSWLPHDFVLYAIPVFL